MDTSAVTDEDSGDNTDEVAAMLLFCGHIKTAGEATSDVLLAGDDFAELALQLVH